MRRLSYLVGLAALLLPHAASAAEALSVEVGKSRLMSLKQQPTVVMVGDPSVADVVIEEGGRLFLLGLQPGETNLHILDGDGGTMMNRRLVVTPPTGGHVSLHRGVEEATFSCNPRCSGVRTPEGTGAVRGTNAPSPAALLDAARDGVSSTTYSSTTTTTAPPAGPGAPGQPAPAAPAPQAQGQTGAPAAPAR
jgi:hypothetical protein